jgi:hypothetical protein
MMEEETYIVEEQTGELSDAEVIAIYGQDDFKRLLERYPYSQAFVRAQAFCENRCKIYRRLSLEEWRKVSIELTELSGYRYNHARVHSELRSKSREIDRLKGRLAEAKDQIEALTESLTESLKRNNDAQNI